MSPHRSATYLLGLSDQNSSEDTGKSDRYPRKSQGFAETFPKHPAAGRASFRTGKIYRELRHCRRSSNCFTKRILPNGAKTMPFLEKRFSRRGLLTSATSMAAAM